jgi:dihydroxyacetone synthase
VLREEKDAAVTLISVGAELSFAVNVADALAKTGAKARIVSFPSHTLFRAQPLSYQREVLRRNDNIPAVVIEPYVALGWERYADAGINMSSFGHSLPGKYIYKHFGFDNDTMVKKVQDFLNSWKSGDIGRGEYVEL